MNPSRRRFLHLLAGAAALSAASSGAQAQTWPTRPVRIIVPFQPGGSTDIFARLAAQKLTEHFGKQFYVENIAGATGNVGTAQAARAAPDGHTLLIAFSSYVVNPTLFAKLPFDPDKDLVPVTLAVSAPNVDEVALRSGEMLVLVSDGVHKHIEPQDLSRVLHQPAPLVRRCSRLVALARARGSRDDATVLVVQREARRGRLAWLASSLLLLAALVITLMVLQ